MEFSPTNKIVNLCLQSIGVEESGKSDEARNIVFQAWNEAKDDLEKYIAAYYVALYQKNVSDKLHWLETCLQLAQAINDVAVQAAYPFLYSKTAECYADLGDPDNAKKNHELAASFSDTPQDKGPFYHGTKADVQIGDVLTPGSRSNYNSEIIMNHVYFTALINGAGLAAALAKGEGRERVYIVEPTGSFENDPNVTNNRFPGNLTRSYRTQEPLKIIGEITDWAKQTPEELQKWRERLATTKGDIIN